MLSKQELKVLKKRLPRDYAIEIASRTGVSKSQVYRILSGKQKNSKIIETALDYAHESAIDPDSLNNKLKKKYRDLKEVS